MNRKLIEKKWQKIWKEIGLANFNQDDIKNKLYVMDMFSYPSGAKLHLGHWFNFGLVDSWARFKKMQGYNVFQPMGFDAFGLPAENYAIKTKVHPKDSTNSNIDTMRQQLRDMGGMFDWDHEIITCEPKYYKWTQWIFLKLLERGLAYKKEAPVNWCPSCRTVLANEQVVSGKCERCQSEVYIKNLCQWFLKITDYADELLSGLDDLDWPEKTKMMQRNWIGRSTGASIRFKLSDSDEQIEVFTTRPDTVFGVTYIVLAPEHDLVKNITTDQFKVAVDEYINSIKYMNEIDRQSITREKTGVFTGAYAINPVNGEQVPVWIADYVLLSYGTGAVMAVPAHDSRDYEFAKKFQLPIKVVIKGGDITQGAYEGDGEHINSLFANGMKINEAKSAIIQKITEDGVGEKKITFRLRDWLISRQRYWGAPIPVIYCDKCGTVPVPEKDLPVELPYDVDFTPTGESPLVKCESFVNTKCPICGGEARREVDTMDTFMCSSWYFLRYPDANNEKEAFNSELINKMLPVDKYVGGAEHSCMHLIYARFITKVLRDAGYLKFNEPFKSLLHQGTILGVDGQKMSKSRGNTVSPDEYINEYGSDVFRTYLMFGFNYTEGGPWSETGIVSINRFFNKIERSYEMYHQIEEFSDLYEDEEKKLDHALNYALNQITNDIDKFQFNTSIARLMELVSAIYNYIGTNRNSKLLCNVFDILTKIIAVCAPHFAEELWEGLGHKESVFLSNWPEVDNDKLIVDTIEIPVQVNGKVKAKITIDMEAPENEVIDLAKNCLKLTEESIVRIIYVKHKIVNIVAKN